MTQEETRLAHLPMFRAKRWTVKGKSQCLVMLLDLYDEKKQNSTHLALLSFSLPEKMAFNFETWLYWKSRARWETGKDAHIPISSIYEYYLSAKETLQIHLWLGRLIWITWWEQYNHICPLKWRTLPSCCQRDERKKKIFKVSKGLDRHSWFWRWREKTLTPGI